MGPRGSRAVAWRARTRPSWSRPRAVHPSPRNKAGALQAAGTAAAAAAARAVVADATERLVAAAAVAAGMVAAARVVVTAGVVPREDVKVVVVAAAVAILVGTAVQEGLAGQMVARRAAVETAVVATTTVLTAGAAAVAAAAGEAAAARAGAEAGRAEPQPRAPCCRSTVDITLLVCAPRIQSECVHPLHKYRAWQTGATSPTRRALKHDLMRLLVPQTSLRMIHERLLIHKTNTSTSVPYLFLCNTSTPTLAQNP